MDLPISLINASYPGANSNDMEKIVTKKIEEKLKEIDGYEYCVSNTVNSFSSVIVEFNTNVDINETQRKIIEKMDDLEKDLPEAADIVEVNNDLIETAGMILSLSGKDIENEDLFKVSKGEFKDWFVMMYYNTIDDSIEEIEVSKNKSELI